MQPNQSVGNMQGNVPPMQPMQMAGAPMDNVMAQGSSEKKKGGKGMIIGMVLLAILAVGGIGFGVYMMLNSNSQTAELNDQISTLKNQNSELMDKISETTSDTTVNIDVDTDGAVNTADYVYVGEWGLKINIPRDFILFGYEFLNGVYHSGKCSELGINGVNYEFNSDNVNDKENMLGYIMRCPLSDEFYYGDLVFSDEVFNYYYIFPNGLSTEDPQWMHDGADAIKEIFLNKENFSKI